MDFVEPILQTNVMRIRAGWKRKGNETKGWELQAAWPGASIFLLGAPSDVSLPALPWSLRVAGG